MSSWLACSLVCIFSGKICVSVCRCCSFVSTVCPVAMRSAEFCICWILIFCLSDMIGDQMVLAYSNMGLVIALYVCAMHSLCLPQVVDVSALSMLSVLRALLIVFVMCVLYVCFGSNVSPSILGLCVVGMSMLLSFMLSFVLISSGNDVKSVAVDLSEFI